MGWGGFFQLLLGRGIKLLYTLFAFLGLDFPQVELQLLAFQDVPVGSATLPRPGGDAG